MTSKRLDFLLEQAAEAFDECRDPFSTDWLVEHKVTADECIGLSRAISAAIDLFRVGLVSSMKQIEQRGIKTKK